MNQRNAKMLRRLERTSKKDKRKFLAFNQHQRAEIRQDYIERGDEVRTRFTKNKKLGKL